MTAPTHKIKAILFDLDGTLADTSYDLGAALNHVLMTEGRAALDAKVIRPMASHGARGLLHLGFGVEPDHPTFAARREALLAYYGAHVCDSTVLFAGVRELLNALAENGIPWGIVTNKPMRFTDALVPQLNWGMSHPVTVVSGDSCAKPKPDPAPMLLACAEMGVLPTECLYIGDAERDIEAGNAVGMPSWVAGWGYLGDNDKPESWGAAGILAAPMDLMSVVNRNH